MNAHERLEHLALEGALAEVAQLARRGSFNAAGQCFVELRRSLEGHLDQEERFSLPDFLQRTGDPDRVVPIIRAQHRGLLAALDRVSAALALGDDLAFCDAVLELHALLGTHQSTEERLLSRGAAAEHHAP
jgi:hypothetical protein